ncbi:MAG: Xaa-Pro peptidase family protein [Oscillospiraceae bacterium]|nr:Xaa-Pro peptidase family protein [Oscillospiraceae bacterium]
MSRLNQIVNVLQDYELDALLLTGPINRRWATGFKSSAGALVATREGSYFIIDGRYIESAKAAIQGVEVIQIKAGQKYPDVVCEIIARHGAGRLGFEEQVMAQGTYTTYEEKLDWELVPAQKLMDTLRASKSASELDLMGRAQAITDQTFAEILPVITPEMTERELAAEIIYRLLKNGADKPSFDPIVVSGPRSSLPHGSPGDHALSGFVTMDFGAMFDGYCADMTRTIAIGTATDEMRRVYDTVLQAQLAGIRAARAGTPGKEIDAAARQVITDAGYGAYFDHGFGHGIGLEVHEGINAGPTEERILPTGAVISAEPGIYLPGQFGVRIEDILHLTEFGSENLTRSPKELIVL